MADILIVDDEPPVVELIRFILEKAGHRVLQASNGQEAAKVLGIEPENPAAPLPALAILDVMMPVMDGYTLAVMMKNHPRASAVPLLILTCKGDMRHLFESMPTVAAFFSKPFEPKKLIAAIDKILAPSGIE